MELSSSNSEPQFLDSLGDDQILTLGKPSEAMWSTSSFITCRNWGLVRLRDLSTHSSSTSYTLMPSYFVSVLPCLEGTFLPDHVLLVHGHCFFSVFQYLDHQHQIPDLYHRVSEFVSIKESRKSILIAVSLY